MKGAASLLHGDGGAGLVGGDEEVGVGGCLLYTSPSPRDPE